MSRHHRLTIIAKQQPFDEERWKELLIAFAYVLHERRQRPRQQTPAPPSQPDGVQS